MAIEMDRMHLRRTELNRTVGIRTWRVLKDVPLVGKIYIVSSIFWAIHHGRRKHALYSALWALQASIKSNLRPLVVLSGESRSLDPDEHDSLMVACISAKYKYIRTHTTRHTPSCATHKVRTFCQPEQSN